MKPASPGQDAVKIRAVKQKPQGAAEELGPNLQQCILGRDAGMTNTVSWPVIESGAPLAPARARRPEQAAGLRDTEEGKQRMQALIETHEHPTDSMIAELAAPAAHFRERAARHFRYIDRISREIDQVYSRMDQLKPILPAWFGLKPEEWIPEAVIPAAPPRRRARRKFFDLLKQVQGLKQKRRERHERAEGLKKSRPRRPANVEVTITKLFNASAAQEKLSCQVIPADSPLYKGRRFNRDMSRSCRGGMRRRRRTSRLGRLSRN